MTKEDFDFDQWFDTLVNIVLDRTGAEFKDKDYAFAKYEEGEDVFDIIDEIVAEYS